MTLQSPTPYNAKLDKGRPVCNSKGYWAFPGSLNWGLAMRGIAAGAYRMPQTEETIPPSP